MTTTSSPKDNLFTVSRYRFLTILKAAINCEEYNFAKQAAMLWLVNYPGDLFVQYFQAVIYENLGKVDEAGSIYEELIALDPFFVEPYQSLAVLSEANKNISLFKSLHQYLKEQTLSDAGIPNWLKALWHARESFSSDDFENALLNIHQSLVDAPPTPIPAILHLKTVYKMENADMLANLCEIYQEKWPKCLEINIFKSLTEMDEGKEAQAVERLHWVSAHDSVGQVITRLMGTRHRFSNMWPDTFEIYFDLPIPAAVTAHLGWNQLESGMDDKSDDKLKPEELAPNAAGPQDITQKITVARLSKNSQTTLAGDRKYDNLEAKSIREILLGSIEEIEEVPQIEPRIEQRNKPQENLVKEMQEELLKEDQDEISEDPVEDLLEEPDAEDTLAKEKDLRNIQKVFSKLAKRLKKPDLNRADNRFPTYVIMSSKKQLEQTYGPNTTAVIDEELKNLVNLIQKLADWGAMLFYPDDAAQMAQLGLTPIITSDAWQTKLALADLDEVLEKRGEMIGALLIVGGSEIIPFHRLPNPTLDSDLDVPSDNPYSTVDENYFIPQWPVGRLPGETGSDAGLLLYQIRHLNYKYQQKTKTIKSIGVNLTSLINWFWQFINNLGQRLQEIKNLGYSAEIWREPSGRVFRTIAKSSDLTLSPPIDSKSLTLHTRHRPDLGYFNLHGVKDGPDWYGQKDFSSTYDGPDYPVALSPDMLNEQSKSPDFILSEACYGANIIDKTHEEALSLKFLDNGSNTFVGSTCIAYGSVTTPLISADYLAEKFWQYVLEGESAGYALMKAKLNLAEEMLASQGFLDGEDQKTLLSFVLFGDPLVKYDGLKGIPKPLMRIKSHPPVRTLSDSDLELGLEADEVPGLLSKQVKKAVEKYLPGLHDAQIQINKSAFEKGSGTAKSKKDERYVVTMKKSIELQKSITHQHYARMTFDNKGKLIKFTTSR